MSTTTISKMDLINSIVDAMEEFGIENIVSDTTTIFVNKVDFSDVEIADTEFNTFTEAHATMASFFLDYNGGDVRIDRRQVRQWLNSLCGVEFD